MNLAHPILPQRGNLFSFSPGEKAAMRAGFISPASFQFMAREKRLPRAVEMEGCQQGFTLMELVVVVAIIGIMTAMIIPEMRGTFADARLRAAGRDLVNVFSLASSRAISLNESCRVQLDPQDGRYLVERAVRDGVRDDFIPLKDVPGGAGKLDPTIAIEVRQADTPAADDTAGSPAEGSVPDAISFYADGTADAAEIRLRDRDGFQLVLQLNAVTARVKILEPSHE